MTLAACAAEPTAPSLPPDPPQAVDTPYFDPPSAMRAVQSRAAGRIWDELAPRFHGLERHSRLLVPGTDRDTVIAHYGRALPGWAALRIDAQPRGGWAFGLTHGRCVLAVMAIDPGPDAQQPAAVISNLKRGDVRSPEPQDEDRPRTCA